MLGLAAFVFLYCVSIFSVGIFGYAVRSLNLPPKAQGRENHQPCSSGRTIENGSKVSRTNPLMPIQRMLRRARRVDVAQVVGKGRVNA